MRHIAFSLALLLLSGCTVAVDDPNNIPERGHWRAGVKLAGFTIDDRSITAAEAPFEVQGDLDEDKGCFEPRFKTIDELNMIGGLKQSKCHVDSFDRDGASITAHGRCEPTGTTNIKVSGGFDLSAEEARDRIKGLATSDFSLHLPDGQTMRLHRVYTLSWTRLGPC